MKPLFQPWLARLRARPSPALHSHMIDPTAVIHRSLREAGLLPAEPATPPADTDGAIIEGDFRVVGIDTATADTAAAAAPMPPANGSFSAGQFTAGGATRSYKLFVPAGFTGQRLPLIVMLHGCKQDPDDFARGTRMNLLAQQAGALVLYPAQAPRSNTSRCWNWFQPGDQRRDAGEPALLAAMTGQIIATHQVDPRRVHVAGLSAGGAMAAILGREYPDLYASIGVHSGLPPGAAHDVPSAFAAMKHPATPNLQLPNTPVIVFHGDRDTTVDPRNGEHVLGAAGARTKATGEAGRHYTQTVIRNADGLIRAEHWLVHGGGHAWSGGDGSGSYADARGPDASREMLRFFREHPLG